MQIQHGKNSRLARADSWYGIDYPARGRRIPAAGGTCFKMILGVNTQVNSRIAADYNLMAALSSRRVGPVRCTLVVYAGNVLYDIERLSCVHTADLESKCSLGANLEAAHAVDLYSSLQWPSLDFYFDRFNRLF